MYGGLYAAQVAAEGIKKGDVSKKFLKKYEQMWDAEFGKLYRRLMRIRQILLNVPDDKLSKMIAEASKLDTQRCR
jgi:flavin-dependent dehydrogenase